MTAVVTTNTAIARSGTVLAPTGSRLAAGPDEVIACIANQVITAPIAAASASLIRRALVLRRSVSMSLYDTTLPASVAPLVALPVVAAVRSRAYALGA